MKVYSFRKEQLLMGFYCTVIVVAIIAGLRAEYVSTFAMPMDRRVVLIDPGHGGFDPGMVGENILEKDVNLEIALLLQGLLEQGGSTVLLTRNQDEALARTKSRDMDARRLLANTAQADVMISIHQNSYPSENVTGTQVFFYEGSDQSRRLAEILQAETRAFLNQTNNREARSSTSYYILRQTEIPAVIIECGFLSSPREARLLGDDEYQERMAWAIYQGIVKFFNAENSPS